MSTDTDTRGDTCHGMPSDRELIGIAASCWVQGPEGQPVEAEDVVGR